jgi:hypothetical protein
MKSLLTDEDQFILRTVGVLENTKSSEAEDIEITKDQLDLNRRLNLENFKNNYREYRFDLHFLALKLVNDNV